MKRFLYLFISVITVCICAACHSKKKADITDAELLHNNVDKLTQVIIYDVFTPPVASRIYGYTTLAAYEATRYSDPKYASLIAQLKGFGQPPVPQKGKSYNYALAATKALFTVAHKVTFSIDTLKKYEDGVYARFQEKLDDSTYTRSINFGEQIGKLILKRAAVDNYPQTRGKPKYLGNNGKADWRPTPPDYFDGVEYCWGTMEPFAINSSKQFPLPHPPAYSTDTNSVYYQQAKEVYHKNKTLTTEEKQVAKFWDDNPFVTQHNGHVTFANKKITPGGHWIGITAIACRQTKADAPKTALAYALTSIALFDSFICSWQAKYDYSYIRPVSEINEMIDHYWMPLLQTPPFPEYPAGHADISGASATVLTHIFGDNFSFQDTTERRYVGIERKFPSFLKAAEETAMSRFYGGIHNKNSCLKGADQGKMVGSFIINKLKLYN
ncbi:hypothetical protein GCM10027037_09400 [Mucilaginibacter koreensis]